MCQNVETSSLHEYYPSTISREWVLTDTAEITHGGDNFHSRVRPQDATIVFLLFCVVVCAECDPASGKREWVLTDVADMTQLGTSERVMAKREKIREYSPSTPAHIACKDKIVFFRCYC